MPKITKKPVVKTIADRINALKLPERVCLWKGPDDLGPQGGITFSLLSRFLACRERFRLLVVEGLKPAPSFQRRMEYGNMIHHCEETHLAGLPWEVALQGYCQKLIEKHGGAAQEIEKWYNICKIQFPIYLRYWEAQPKPKVPRKQIWQEKVFNVAYKLPSGRKVCLKGKFDSVYLSEGLWVKENKAKGEANAEQLEANLPTDLQTMIYLTALNNINLEEYDGEPIRGVHYNVVRRPLASWGKHSIKQKEGRLDKKTGVRVGAETDQEFYARLGEVIEQNAGDFFLSRWSEVTPECLEHFQKVTLNPVLESLCDWWEWIKVDPFDPWTISCGERKMMAVIGQSIHWMFPSGVWNPALEGSDGDLDNYILTGDAKGLYHTKELFPELAA